VDDIPERRYRHEIELNIIVIMYICSYREFTLQEA